MAGSVRIELPTPQRFMHRIFCALLGVSWCLLIKQPTNHAKYFPLVLSRFLSNGMSFFSKGRPALKWTFTVYGHNDYGREGLCLIRHETLVTTASVWIAICTSLRFPQSGKLFGDQTEKK